MARFEYQALTPGTYCVGRNADGSKRFVKFTPDYCRRQAELGNSLLKSGINIPACFEHLDEARPTELSRDALLASKTRGTVGWVADYKVDPSGAVKAIVEVPNQADADRVKAIRFCSPRIDKFTDGKGNDWGEIIQHIALTPRPVQVQPAAVELGLGRLDLSLDPEKGTDMADEKDEKDTEKAEPVEGEETPEAEEGEKADSGFGGLVQALRECCGINIPDEVTDLRGLIIAVKANGDAAPPADPANPEGGTTTAPIKEETAPIAMSLEGQKTQAVSYARAALKQRAKALGNRVGAKIVASLEGEAEKVDLSFDGKGNLSPNALTIRLDAYEVLPENAFFPPKGERYADLSHTAEVIKLPTSLSGKHSDQDILDEWDNTGKAKD